MTEYVTSSRGDRVAYDHYGSEGPALVFVAGAGPFRAVDPVTTRTAQLAASQGLSTFVFDRLGRGESTAEGSLDLDRELEAIRSVVGVAGGSAVLCGHSSGCSISLCAAAAGLPVRGLVLWEAPVSAPAKQTAEWIDEFERRLDAGELEAAQEWYMKDMPPQWLAGAKASPAWPSIFGAVGSLRADGQSLRLATAELDTTLGNTIKVPVLATYATSTFPGMPEAATRIQQTLPQTQIRQLKGADHVWDVDAFASTLVTFVHTAQTQRHSSPQEQAAAT